MVDSAVRCPVCDSVHEGPSGSCPHCRGLDRPAAMWLACPDWTWPLLGALVLFAAAADLLTAGRLTQLLGTFLSKGI